MRALTLLLTLSLAGCGACQKLASSKQAFRAEAPVDPAAPHLRVELPKALLDDWLDDALETLPDTGFELPGMGEVSRFIGNFSLSPRRLALNADLKEKLGFDLDFDLKKGSRTIFGMAVTAKAPMKYDAKAGKLTLALRADMFDSVTPRLQPGAVDKLVSAIYAEVPTAARLLIKKATVKALVQRGIDEIVRRAYAELRNRVLKPIGEIARYEVQMPKSLPLRSLGATLEKNALRIDARTTLAAAGIDKAPKAKLGNSLRMQVSSDTLVALGNWAMSGGKIPKRYKSDGKPAADGGFEAGFDWVAGARPLKVHLWSLDTTAVCIHAVAGASPQLAYEKGEISVGFEDGALEVIDGPPLLGEALGLMGISEQAFSFTKKIASETKLKIGKGTRSVLIKSARLDSSGLLFEFNLGRSKSVGKKKKGKS